jgi:hypothetical protein
MPPRLTGHRLTIFLAKGMATFLVMWVLLVLACWRVGVALKLPDRIGVEGARALVFLLPLGLVLLLAKPVIRWLRGRSEA